MKANLIEEDSSTLPSSLPGWMLSVLFVVYQLYLQLSMGALMPPLMRDLSLNAMDISVLTSSFYIVYILMQVPSGALLRKWGPDVLICLGAGCCALGCLLFAGSNTLLSAISGRLLTGLGASCAFVCSISIAATGFSKARVGLMIGLAETIMMVGTWAGINGLSHALILFNWRSTMTFNASLGCAISLLACCLIPKQKTNKSHSDSYRDFVSIMKRAGLWWHGLYIGLMFSNVTVFASTWAIPFLIKEQGVTHAQAVWEASWTYLGVALASPFAGLLQRFNRNLLVCYGLSAMLALVFLISLLFVKHMNPGLGCIPFFILGIASSITVLNYEWVQTNTPREYASMAVGFTNTVALLLVPVLHLIIGRQKIMSYPILYTMIASMFLASMLVFIKQPRLTVSPRTSLS
ncbi:MFS transporter [Legionella spiritensis]|uniref:MFS transporter n=1 Tax=Legionella spiritensis TaxID=452 RepID=UPI000F6BB7B2|nr:MFS transporter [Legionella spiritensis]VEG92459.1 major facilitator family transporter [Legionella spiritensis]